jgi:thiosulfate/3-mercaptopyruvate sulfurtransferase
MISISQLVQQLENPKSVIVDVRTIAAYNGWQLQNEARGGHISGSVTFPLSWIEALKPSELGSTLENKGVLKDKTVVVYGYTSEDCAVMVSTLRDLGYQNVLAYEAGIAEWAMDDKLPMSCLSNYRKLVHPAWVHNRLKELQSDPNSGKGIAIFHVSLGLPEEYQTGHIPGAAYLDTNELESPLLWNRLPDDELKAVLLAHGITHNKTVVLYGWDHMPYADENHLIGESGQSAAIRTAVIMMYAGVEDVRLLDGGLGAWISCGYETETDWQNPTRMEDFGAQVPGRPEFIIDSEQVKALLADRNSLLVSVRSWSEYIGVGSGYNYIEAKGRIAGAVWGNLGRDTSWMQHFRNIDNTIRNYHEIASMWWDVGITPEKRVAFYCGTGWRASEAFFYAHLMGWENISIYDGGWCEWSQDESNPTERGTPIGRYNT